MESHYWGSVVSGTTRRRGVFDPTALGDIDELLPPLPPATPGDSTPPDSKFLPQSTAEISASPLDLASPTPEVFGDSTRSGRVAGPKDAPTGESRVSPAEVAIAPDVYRSLRAVTLQERASTPTTARSYGRVALDAIEAHSDQLAGYWKAPQAPATGLFSRRDAETPRRRRHMQAPARVPLAGIIASDIRLLDQLATDWGAGSRSALVEVALRMYLPSDK